jgi:hypothetical protein
LTLDHACARTEAKLTRPRTSLVSVHCGIDNSDEFQKLRIFTLRGRLAAIRSDTAREHSNPYSTSRCATTHMFGEPQRAFMHMQHALSRLAQRARPNSASNRMAAATALVHAATRRSHTKHAAHGGQRLPTSAPCESGHARRPSATHGADERAAAQRGEQVHRDGAACPAAQCCTCRAQRGLGKIVREWAGRGCYSRAGMHASALVATGLLGNPTTALRLRAGLSASHDAKTPNLVHKFVEK